MKKHLKIKTFDPAYQDEVIALILGIQQQEFGVSITADDQPDLGNIPNFYQSGNGNFWVAIEDEQVVGTIALLDIGNHQVALRKMFVDKASRGSAKGVAKSLLGACHEWSVKQGVKGIYLGTIDVYQAAMRFYEKNGYQQIKKHKLPKTFPLIKVDNVFYQKSIRPNNKNTIMEYGCES